MLIKNPSKQCASELVSLLQKAKAEFPGLTPDNFFPKSSCDIEQDIYRLDMQKISTLGQVIWENERSLLDKITDKDLQDLVSRYWLAYGLSPAKRGEKWKEKFSQYVTYRYGGGVFQLPKNIQTDLEPGKLMLSYHPSLQEIEKSLDNLIESRNEVGDQIILKQLKTYIKSSEISLYI